MIFKIILMVLSCVGLTVGQLRCYTCSFSSVDTDQSCLTITNDTRSVDCSFQYCTILRQEFIDPAGVVASFTRGCDDEPDYLNHEVTDFNFRTFYRACTSDLCNIGDGTESVVGGNLSPSAQYSGQNLLVPGTGSAANLQLSTMILVLNIFFLRYL